MPFRTHVGVFRLISTKKNPKWLYITPEIEDALNVSPNNHKLDLRTKVKIAQMCKTIRLGYVVISQQEAENSKSYLSIKNHLPNLYSTYNFLGVNARRKKCFFGFFMQNKFLQLDVP